MGGGGNITRRKPKRRKSKSRNKCGLKVNEKGGLEVRIDPRTEKHYRCFEATFENLKWMKGELELKKLIIFSKIKGDKIFVWGSALLTNDYYQNMYIPNWISKEKFEEFIQDWKELAITMEEFDMEWITEELQMLHAQGKHPWIDLHFSVPP